MMRCLLPLLLLAAYGPSASAAKIPYYRMDSLTFLSSDVVLCEEVRYEKRAGPAGREYHEGTFTVVRALKGSCEPKQRLTVEFPLTYTRRLMESWGAPAGEAPDIPLGRALLFLTRKTDGAWRPVRGGVKLVIGGETYCYGQFLTNPGPLWLARMAPENIDVPAGVQYGEELLLKDLRIAQEKAKGLTKAVAGYATRAVIRRDHRPR